ncbi:MAG: hypothetical protein ACPGQL_06065 [Thermoplasmatota archaeon]
MGLTRLRAAGLMALLLLAPHAAQAQEIPPEIGDALRPILTPAVNTTASAFENVTGENIVYEDIRIVLGLDVVNVDYQIIGILFGGGKVQADATATVQIEVRAISLERIDEALRAATGEANLTAASVLGVPSDRIAITAEELRILGAGVVLSILQSYLETFARDFIETTVPGMLVQSIRFAWSNTLPAQELRDLMTPDTLTDPDGPGHVADAAVPDIREPPLVLSVETAARYLDRLALYDIIRESLAGNASASQEDPVEEQLRAQHQPRFRDSTAFALLGYGQLLQFEIPPGWRIELNLETPKGFTVEDATDVFVVGQKRANAGYTLDAAPGDEDAPAGIVTLSNRFLVTSVLFGAVLLVGTLIRVPLEVGVLSVLLKRERKIP